MQKKASLLCLLMAFSVLIAACGSGNRTESTDASSSGSEQTVKITLLNSKSEVQEQLEEAVNVFHHDHPNIEIEILTTGNGQSPFEKASQLYAAGNPATISMLDPADVEQFKDRILDLSGEKWVADAIDNSMTVVDGKVLDFPFAVEGFGFIYNKRVLDEAVGGSFDPTSIQTRDGLKNLFMQIEAAGKQALHISPLDWSLGAHFLNFLYADQSQDYAQVETFIEKLRTGNADVAGNAVFNGLMDTFDLMKEHNSDKKSPLTATYDKGPELIGNGEVGLWFMGNWAWPNIQAFDPEGEYGFLPVPISNNASDYGNTQIATAVTKRLVVDKERSTPDQQAAAKQFLEWLVYESNGQDFLVNKASIIPAFKNIALEPRDPLSKSIKDYMNRGKTVVGMTSLPSDHWSVLGASMQKYLANVIDRAGLAKEIEDYWKNVK